MLAFQQLDFLFAWFFFPLLVVFKSWTSITHNSFYKRLCLNMSKMFVNSGKKAL